MVEAAQVKLKFIKSIMGSNGAPLSHLLSWIYACKNISVDFINQTIQIKNKLKPSNNGRYLFH